MKKKIGFFLIFGFVSCLFISPVMASCDCDIEELINKASSSTKAEILESLLDAADFAPSFSIQSSFASIMKASQDEYYFQQALKNYINKSCFIQNNKIYCN